MQEPNGYVRKSISEWACRDVNELYENISKVGSGTYGEVNKARLRSNPTEIVALKKIKDESETEGFPITALREISLLQQCDHPNIIRLLDIVVSKVSDSDKKKRGSTYLVFEYMEHELLGLIETCNLTSAQIKCILKQLLEGLHYLHQKMIIHRDIKSANLLINNKGEVKIADFGLAKKYNPNTGKLTQRVVTRWYRAPELLLGSRKYTTQIDIWALGCVFAELLIGKSHAIFPAQKTPDQFEIICEKCGTPDEDQWPGFKSMPFYANMIPRKNYPKGLTVYMRKQMKEQDSLALDLLNRMLTLNPTDRITAQDALNHQYFTSEPLPCTPSEMPKIEKDCHAYVLNAERKSNAAAAKDLKDQNNQKQQQQQQYDQRRGGQQQNRNYGGGRDQNSNRNYNNNYNNNNQNQNQSHHHNRNYNSSNQSRNTDNRRPHNEHRSHSNYHDNRDSRDNRDSNRDNRSATQDKAQKGPLSMISNSISSKDTGVSSNLASLFNKNDTTVQNSGVSKDMRTEHVGMKEEPRNANKSEDNEALNNKRIPNHELNDFESITKKRQVPEPVVQNN
jgi:cyclin-dependent kinase 12/13